MRKNSIVLIILLLLCTVVSLKASRPDGTEDPVFDLTYSDVTQDGIVHLRWSISGLDDITNTVFVFQRSRDGIVWQDFASIIGTNDAYNTLNDSIYACGDSIRYRGFAGIIDVADTNWLGISDVKTLFVKDKTPPENIPLNVVSIDLDGHINFTWQKASSPDVKGYIVMRQSGQSLSELMRVEGIETTSYIDTLLDKTQALLLEFKLQVFDGCYNYSPYSAGLFITDAKVVYNGCQDDVSINYSSAGSPVREPKELSLYGQRQDGTFNKITTVPYNANHSFILSSVEAVSYVAFKVETLSLLVGAAFSYIDSFSVLPPPVPNEFYITNVSANDDGTVDIFTSLDHSIPFGSVELYCSVDNSASEEIVSWRKVVPTVWNDSKANASKASYSYFGIINDSCGHKAHQSSIHTTILLKGAIVSENTFRLSWSEYEGFDVAYYRIYMQEEIIDSVENAGSYDVTIPSLEEAYGIKFFVEGVSLDQITSRSNTVSLITSDLPDIFLPSGFIPDGVTKIYKPIGRLDNLDEYDFRIYNMSGKMVFRSTNPEIGWNGDNVAPGIYICKVRIRRDKNVSEHTANVTVVR